MGGATGSLLTHLARWAFTSGVDLGLRAGAAGVQGRCPALYRAARAARKGSCTSIRCWVEGERRLPFFMTRGDSADRGRRESVVHVIEDQIKKIQFSSLTP